jgi:serine protease inhibitor
VQPGAALTQYIQDANPNMYTRYVKLDFPRFESGSKMMLNEILKAMGISNLFQPKDPSDFCLFEDPSFIDVIQQETSISVSEKGVEAAAATANVLYTESGEETTPPDTVYMKLERPFFYTIRETSTNTPLFIGYQGSVK